MSRAHHDHILFKESDSVSQYDIMDRFLERMIAAAETVMTATLPCAKLHICATVHTAQLPISQGKKYNYTIS